MGTFQVADAPIIRPGCVRINDAGKHAAGMQQVRYRAKRCWRGYFGRWGGIQVSPGRWDERTRAVGKDQNEIQLAMAPHPAKQRERLALQWMAVSDDLDRRWIALEVGSVLPFRCSPRSRR